MLWTDPFTALLAQFTRQAGFLPVGDLAVSDIPQGVEPDGITASMHNGVLTIIVPKPEAIKVRTIAIGAKED